MVEPPIPKLRKFRNDDFRWLSLTAIDVKDSSGYPRRGIICDLVPKKGLIVDFDYVGHQADLVPFAECCWPSKEHIPLYTDYAKGDTAEVLHQRSPAEPWRWYRSKVLAVFYGENTCVFVEVDVCGEPIGEVADIQRVRQIGLTFEPIWNELYRHVSKLPSANFAPLEVLEGIDFPMIWCKVTQTKLVKVARGRIVYISRESQAYDSDTVAKKLQSVYDIRTNYDETRGRKRTADGENIRQNISPDHETTSTNGSIAYLPLDLLCEIFSYLDTQDQIRCRHVCHAWDVVTFDVRMDLERYELPRDNWEVFQDLCKLATILHKMVTATTKTLILIGHEWNVQGSLDAVCEMLIVKDIRVPMMVVSYAEHALLQPASTADDSNLLLGRFPKIKNVCESLILEQVFLDRDAQVTSVSATETLAGVENVRMRRRIVPYKAEDEETDDETDDEAVE